MEKIKNNLNLILYLIITVVLTCILFWAIDQKEGFHEDEIFSYGASNSSIQSIFLPYARVDNIDSVMKDKNPFITIKNFIYYRVLHPEEYLKKEERVGHSLDGITWRNKEDATEYLQIDNFGEAIDFATVYWNTAKDVHPPLFYFAVHIVSILFWGRFSKYIIFIINLIFFLSTIWVLRKILDLIDKKHLEIPNLILYGASIGAISTVMFQRMYMMLTFFTILFLYINLKIYYNDFNLDKKLKRQLCATTVLGFLTQYYFCFYAAILALCMIIIMIVKKQKDKIRAYFLQFVKSAIIGIVIFPAAVYHIFFSYRGVNGIERDFGIATGIQFFFKNIFLAFSMKNAIGIILFITLIVVLIIKIKRSSIKGTYFLLIIPVIVCFMIVVLTSPYKSLRYEMNLLPIISIIVLLILDEIVVNKKTASIVFTVFAIAISIYGLFTNPIKYLFKGYNNYIEIAKKYKDDRFVLVDTARFTQIQDIFEFQIYKESMIASQYRLEKLAEVKEFEEEDEIILGIKTWVEEDIDEVLKKVMEYTGFENYEFIYGSSKSAKMNVYRLYR